MNPSRTDDDHDSSKDDEDNIDEDRKDDDDDDSHDDDDDSHPSENDDEYEYEDSSDSPKRAKKMRREEPHQLVPTGITAPSAPALATSSTAQVPPPIEIPTNDNARTSNLERDIAELETEIAELKTEIVELKTEKAELKTAISDASAFLNHVESNDREALKNTFEHLQNSSRNLIGVFSPKQDFDAIREKLQEFIKDCNKRCTNILRLLGTNKKQLLDFQKRLRAALRTDQDNRNRDGIGMTAAEENDPKSGLFYIQDIHWIGLTEGPTNDSYNGIGILEPLSQRNRRRFRVREDLEKLTPTESLQKAWDLVTSTTLDKQAFIDKLVEQLKSLDATILRSAWNTFQSGLQSDNINAMGEMPLQQFVYPPFAGLFKAAVGSKIEERYKADQDVKSSLSIEHKKEKTHPVFETKKVVLQPDGAALMHQMGWDVLGMMELKDGQCGFKSEYRNDFDKCTLVTAISALAMKRCIEAKDYRRVAIPFFIASGGMCSLFATTLDESGKPSIKVVGYPNGDWALARTFTTSSCHARKEIFTALAVLLDQCKTLFDEYERSYKQRMELRTPALPEAQLSFKSRRSDDAKGSQSNKTQSTGDRGSRKSNEQSALEAADCGGQFVSVTSLPPSSTTLRLLSTSIQTDEHEHSPYFFTALPASSSSSSSKVLTKNQVFLKVWNTDDVKMDSVQAEWRHYKQALEAGVPVAAPALAEVAVSTSSSGSKYLVIAVDYIQQDEISDMEDLKQFCLSLVDAVDRLHNQAKLLHCDLKPDNVRWRHGVVRLIDFGHARPISSAKCVRGTEGFEAPEILDGKPCSTKTDAYAVGKTIMAMLRELYDETSMQKSSEFRCLEDVAAKLTHADHQLRWCLKQALERIQTIVQPGNDSFASIKTTKLEQAANPVTASPQRMPRTKVQAKLQE